MLPLTGKVGEAQIEHLDLAVLNGPENIIRICAVVRHCCLLSLFRSVEAFAKARLAPVCPDETSCPDETQEARGAFLTSTAARDLGPGLALPLLIKGWIFRSAVRS